MDANAINPETINVGNLNTSPVFRYSPKTGKNKIAAIATKIKAIIPKNLNEL